MATYQVQTPDGEILEIDGPDDATDFELQSIAAQNWNPPTSSYADSIGGGRGTVNPTREAILGAQESNDSLPVQESNGRSWGDAASDGFSSFGASVNNTLKTVTDLAGTDNAVSNFLGENAKSWQSEYSPEYKAELKKQEAEKAALGDDPSYAARAALMAKQTLRNPIEGLGELAGNIAPMAVGGLAGLGAKGIAALSAAMGAGAVKGGIAETIQNAPEKDLLSDPLYAQLREDGLSANDAKARLAVERSTYGEAYGKILLGGGIGLLVGKFGSVENALANMGKKGVATEAAKEGLIKSFATGVGKEVATEIPQEMTETYLGNKGASNRGANIAADQGVVESGVKAGILSAVSGGAAGVSGRATPADIIKADTVDSAVDAFTEATKPQAEARPAVSDIGRAWQDLGVTPSGETSSIAARNAGQAWQGIAPEQTGSLEQQRAEVERAGAALSQERDARLKAVGQEWQNLGITNPADDLQAQRAGMRSEGTPDGSVARVLPTDPTSAGQASAAPIQSMGDGATVGERGRVDTGTLPNNPVDQLRELPSQAPTGAVDVQNAPTTTESKQNTVNSTVEQTTANQTPAPVASNAATTTVVPGAGNTTVQTSGVSSPSNARPNVVIRDVRGFGGEKLGDIVEPHDGTEKGIREAADRTNVRLQDEFVNASNAGSRMGATDENGQPAFAISPNGNVSRLGTKEAAYTWGDLSAAPDKSNPAQPPKLSARQVAINAEIERARVKKEAAHTARVEGQKPVEGLRIGSTPNSSESVSVKNGIVHIGKYPAQNYDTGEDVKVPNGASNEQIAQALKSAGAISGKSKIFGLNPAKEKLTVPVSQRTQKPADLGHVGKDNIPMVDGGVPFKTNSDAKKAKKQQPLMRVIKVDGGYALAPKSEAQIKAQEAAGKRLRNSTGNTGLPMSVHEFVAREGGLSKDLRSNLGVEGNPRIGAKRLYAGTGGLTIEQASEKLKEAGYLSPNASHSQAFDLIRKSLTNPQYTAEGTEAMAQAALDTQFEDHLAAQQEAAQNEDFDDPFSPMLDDGFIPDDFEVPGYSEASDPIKVEVNALLALAEAQGIDTDAIKYEAANDTNNESEQAYYEAARNKLQEALATSNRTGSENTGETRNAGEQEVDLLGEVPNASQQAAENLRQKQKETEQAQRNAAPTSDGFELGMVDQKTGNEVAVGQAELKPAEQATAILDAANVTGKERIDVLKDVKQGAITPDELKAAYPAKEEVKQEPNNTGNAGSELTYNKRNRIKTGIKWTDIEGKDDALKVKETNKQNVYPKPDYQSLIDGGMHPVVAHIVKQVYDSIATTPKISRGVASDDQLKQYIDGVNRVMDAVMSWANNPAQTSQWMNKIAQRASAYLGASRGTPVSLSSMTEVSQKSLLDTVYPNGWKEYRAEINLVGSNKLLGALQPNTDEAIKAQKDIDKGWPEKQEAWKKQGYKIIDGSTAKPNTYVSNRGVSASLVAPFGGRSITIVSRHFENATSKDDAEVQAFLSAQEEDYKTRFVVLDKNNRLQAWGLSQEGAEEQARNLTKREAKSGKIDEKGISVESAERVGVEHRLEGENVSSDKLKETFGFKGVNFGNWMLGDSPKLVAERQLHLNHAYDSFMDLAEVLGVPPKALSLDGLLGLAIGAQGGGKAAAHFVPGVNEINLTRTSGAGSLAHEWGHALDHYFARQADLTRQSEPFLTSNASSRFVAGTIRPEIVEAFKSIVSSMTERKMTQEEYDAQRKASMDQTKKYVSNWLAAIKRDFELAVKNTKKEATPGVIDKFDALAERVKALDIGEGRVAAGKGVAMSPVVSEIRDLFKTIGYGTLNIEQVKGLQANIDALKYKADAIAAGDTHVPNRNVPSRYLEAARELDGGKKTKLYWSTKLEMFARAFDAFVSDSLDAKAAKNTYLSHAGRGGETVPNGSERTAINADIQKLIDTIETKETDKGVAMFSRDSVPDVSDEKTGPAIALLYVGQSPDLYRIPVSNAADLETIAQDKGMKATNTKDANAENESFSNGIEVDDPNDPMGAEGRRNLSRIMSARNERKSTSGNFRTWDVVTDKGAKGVLTQDGNRVWINVAGDNSNKHGSYIYDLAANYAHNNGLTFIGDPDGLTDAGGMRRRLENMLNAAVKYQSTDFLEPHGKQLVGNKSLGIPALKWTKGDTLSNIRSMMDASVASNEFAQPIANAFTQYAPGTQSYEDGFQGTYDDAELSGLLESDGRERGDGKGGVTTLKRTAFIKSLLSGAEVRRSVLDKLREKRDGGSDQPSGASAKSWYSRGSAKATGLTQSQFTTELTKAFGAKVAERLQAKGVVVPLADQSKLPSHVVPFLRDGDIVYGFYDPKTDRTYAVLENLTPEMVKGLVLHEVGVHFGFKSMLGDAKYANVMKRLDTLRKAGSKAVKTAYAEAKKNAVRDSQVPEETLAYLVQNNPELGIIKEIIAKIKAFLYNEFGIGGKYLTEDDLTMLARAAVDHSSRTEDGGSVLSFSRTKDQTNTDAFRKWFGSSAVVDADGKPLVVYHGSGMGFSQFTSNRGKLIYFTKDKDVAEGFAEAADENQREQGNYDDEIGRNSEDGGASIYPVYLSVKNPFDPDSKDHIAQLSKRAALEVGRGGHYGDVERHQREIEKLGFDGIYVREKGHEDANERDIAVFSPTQIKSATGNNGDFDGTNPDIRFSRNQTSPHSWDSPETSKFDDLVYLLQDKQVDTKRVIESIRETAGALADEKNVYLQEELFHGRAAAGTESFINNELSPLLKEMKMRGIDIATLEEYLHARHAEEANNLIADREPGIPDGGSGMTTQAARDYLAALPAAERTRLEAVASKVDAILAKTRQMYADYNLESQSTVDGWGDMFSHYVPLMREDKDGGMGIGQGFSIKGKEVKGRTGSTRKVVDILANIALQRERAVVRGEKNRVSTALVGLVTANPNENFWKIGPPPTERVYDPKTNSVVDRADPLFKSRENVIVAKIKDPSGEVKEVAVTFNEDNERAVRMAAALKNLDASQLNGLMGVSAKISRYFSAINTQYNPIFGTVNLVRDFQGALLNLSTTPLKSHKTEIAGHTLSALKGIYLDARAARDGRTPTSSWAALWEDFQSEGGQTGYRDMFANSGDRAKALEHELNPTKWMDSPLGKVFTANGTLKVPLEVAQKTAGGVFDWLSDYNLAMENAVRLSAYKVGLEQGMSKQQAASLAKNLTVNFNRKGQVGQQAGALYAFFNASMQGTARIGQTLFDMDGSDVKSIRLSSTGKKIVYGGMLLGTMQALLLAAAGFDDEEPPDFVRERSLVIPTGGKSYITIPMPLGFHVIPNMGRIPTEFALGGFKQPAKHITKLLGLTAGAFNPVGGGASLVQMLSPTAIDPLVALAENKDWTGKPIAKTSYNKATPGHALVKDTASYPSKVLSEAINLMTGGTKYTAGALSPTPDQIDYLWGQATGGVGRELSKVQQTASATISGEDLPMHKIPLLGRFYGNADTQSAQSSKFYAAMNRMSEHESEIKGLQKDKKSAELTEYLAENPEARLFQTANKVELEIQKMRQMKREMLKLDAPKERIKALDERITKRMEQFNEVYSKAKKRELARTP